MPSFLLSPRVLIPAGVAVLALIVVAVFALTSNSSEPLAIATTTTTEPIATSTTMTIAVTTSTVAPTTTTLYAGPTAPLTGLPMTDEALLERRVMGVKIDNHPLARPQSGLSDAEAVYEIVVEGGITRFLAMFQTTDSDYLGPMRSGRPTDAGLMKPTGGTFAISGASFWIRRYLLQQDILLLGEGAGAFRIPSRSAPHNLYVDTNELREVANGRGHPDEPPPPFWEFGAFPDDAESAESVTTTFTRSVSATWTWTGTGYERSIRDDPQLLIDEEGEEVPFVFDGVIVLRVAQYTARPAKPSDGVSVPASRTLGSGEATVFARGQVVEGTWQRQFDEDVFELVTSTGETIRIPPGRYWIALVPVSGSVEWS